MQPLQAVHALPLQASSCLSVLPSLCASMPTDAVQVGPLGSPFNTGLKQQFALANVGGQLQQLRVRKLRIVGQGQLAEHEWSSSDNLFATQVLTPIQTIQNTVVPSSQAAVFASTGGAQLLQAGARLQPPKEHRTIFFAGCTPVVSSETVFSLFSQFGLVEDVNLFRPYSGSKTSKVSSRARKQAGDVATFLIHRLGELLMCWNMSKCAMCCHGSAAS